MEFCSTYIWVLLLLNLGSTVALEPISMSAGVIAAGSFLWGLFGDKTQCRFLECCDKHSVIADGKNISALEITLQKNVYGQHLVQDIVTKALRGHLNAVDPAKALALSFHGTTGSGKSFVSQFIAESIFKQGMASKYVKKFIGAIDFPSHADHMSSSQLSALKDIIKSSVKACERSLFIFEDVHKMPPAVLDTVKPFIDHHQLIDNIDYRKSIFIFLSNTGNVLINQKTFELWKTGIQRENIRSLDFESLVRQGAFNEEGGFYIYETVWSTLIHRIPFLSSFFHLFLGGFYRSETISSSLIDHYIPFLPLEEQHVRGCIKNEFHKFGYNHVPSDAMEIILEEMTFFPESEKIYSTTGCKRVAAKVSAYVFGKEFVTF